VETDGDTLEATDLVPFAVAAESGVAAMMTAHVAFPALDDTGVAATLSAPIMDRLRRGLRFDGLVVTDALIMDGALTGRRESDAAVQALQSGVDVESGTLARERLEESLRRYERAMSVAARPTPPVRRGPFESVEGLADALIGQGMVRGEAPPLTGPLDLVVVDDDVGGPYPPSPSDWVVRALGPELVGRYTGGSRVVLVLAEPRAWKGRAGLGDASRDALASYGADAELIVLFGHPRLVEQLPSDAPVLLAWHRQRLLQEAVARWLRARLSP
jgi:hypothetical protein